MAEATPSLRMQEILTKLEAGAQFEKEHLPEKSPDVRSLEETRKAYYDDFAQATLSGLDHRQAMGATTHHERDYRTAQAEMARQWLNNNKYLIGEGCAQMGALVASHPDLLHSDLRNASSRDILNLNYLAKIMIGPDGDHDRVFLHVARPWLSLIAPTAFLGQAPENSQVKLDHATSMFDGAVEMLKDVCDGRWYGPDDLINRLPEEISQIGLPVLVRDTTGSKVITGVHLMGFLSQRTSDNGMQTIGEPMLPAVVSF